MNWCIIIPLLVGAICAVLGYLLGKLLGGETNSFVDVYKNRIAKLEADLEDCKSSRDAISSSFSASASAFIFNADAAKSVFGKRIKENDLTIIEGIGPKIQELFHKQDIKTWYALAACSVEKCQEILNAGGEGFKIHNPGTWPKQAVLAHQGKWKELYDWQAELDGGK